MQMGFAVKCSPSGCLSVRMGRNEQFRIDQQEHGDWVHRDNLGYVGGDNITLVRTIEPGISYQEVVYRLSGAPSKFAALLIRLLKYPPRNRHVLLEQLNFSANRPEGDFLR